MIELREKMDGVIAQHKKTGAGMKPKPARAIPVMAATHRPLIRNPRIAKAEPVPASIAAG